MENIFYSIISKLKICLSNIVENLSNLEMTDDFHDLDDSTFLNYVRNELTTICEENNEKCLDDVQYEIIVEIVEAAQDISNQVMFLILSVSHTNIVKGCFMCVYS